MTKIVRLARKGWTVGQILDSLHKACPSGQQRWLTEEQVQQVIDEAEAMSSENDVPQWECMDAEGQEDK